MNMISFYWLCPDMNLRSFRDD
uniref:Uncharacterized protein n=1 Tax=Rhizophora mucronata TaxID=61149 RepID=A0A2P2PVL3_RHIMU